MSVNKVILLGNVGADPDISYPQQGQTLARIRLATSDRAYTTQAGVQVPERTEWHTVVVWGRQAELVERYVRKGSKLYIEGKLRTRIWEDRNQVKRYTTEVYADVIELLGGVQAHQAPAQPGMSPAQQ